MRTILIGLTCVAGLHVATQSTQAAKPAARKKPIQPIAIPLQGIELVKATSLTKTGNVITPRKDCRVPKLLVDLLGAEDIVRIYPQCTFAMVDGHPVWSWSSLSNTGIYEKKGEALRARLAGRLRKLGFKPLPNTPDSIPNTQRGGERPFKYRKTEQGRDVTVEFGNLVRWTGGRRPAVGISLACVVRGTQKIATPKLSEVTAAMATLAPPSRGKQPIPAAILKSLQNLPVTRVQLAGTGTTWYSLTVVTPKLSLTDFMLQTKLESQLVAASFRKDDRIKYRPIPKTEQLLRYVKINRGESSNCRIGMQKTATACRIHMFVQP